MSPPTQRRRAACDQRATVSGLAPPIRIYQDEKATCGMVDLKTRIVGDVGTRVSIVMGAAACLGSRQTCLQGFVPFLASLPLDLPLDRSWTEISGAVRWASRATLPRPTKT